MSSPVRVAVTGAAGQIGYALLFRVASGQLLGPDTPVHLSLLEIPDAVKAAEGTAMELDDSAFPLLAGIDIYDDAKQAFDGVNVALLVGARPRTKGMERADLLEANGGIFKPQGEAIAAGAADDIKVLVVGNPANTNALIAQQNADGVPAERFTAMTRLDQNRAMTQLAKKAGAAVGRGDQPGRVGQPLAVDVSRRVQRQGRRQAGVGCRRAGRAVARPRTSSPRSASAARRSSTPAAPHPRHRPPTPRSTTCTTGSEGTKDGDWVSMAVVSDGSYDVPEGIISSFPVTTSGGEYEIVQGLEINDLSRERIDATAKELTDEREAVQKLGLVG